jgi:hypothetical protein
VVLPRFEGPVGLCVPDPRIVQPKNHPMRSLLTSLDPKICNLTQVQYSRLCLEGHTATKEMAEVAAKHPQASRCIEHILR